MDEAEGHETASGAERRERERRLIERRGRVDGEDRDRCVDRVELASCLEALAHAPGLDPAEELLVAGATACVRYAHR